MKAKKLWSVALVLALSFALCVPSLAAYSVEESKIPSPSPDSVTVSAAPSTGNKITIDAVVALPQIEITINAPSIVIVNPYGLAVSVESLSISSKSDTIISMPAKISNSSGMKVKVSASATATTIGEVDVVTSSEALSSSTSPAVFLQLRMDNVSSDTDAENFTGASVSTDKIATVQSSTGSTTSSATITMEAAAVEGNTTTPTLAAYILTGNTSLGTTKTWAEGMGVTVNMLFDITSAQS